MAVLEVEGEVAWVAAWEEALDWVVCLQEECLN